jgi:hypothetical protein
MRRKQITALCLILTMLFMAVPGTGVFALDGREYSAVVPFYLNTSSVSVNLTFSGANANCQGTIAGFSGTSMITATLSLYRVSANGSMTLLRSWSGGNASTLLTVSGTQAVSSGYTYRLSVSAQVTRNGTTENVSNYVEKTL